VTPLRRARREVYRVYAEDEFLAGPDRAAWLGAAPPGGAARHGRPLAAWGAGDGRHVRFAGTAMLLAVAGAVGALITINSPQSVPRTGLQKGERAARRSLIFSRVARAQRWPARAHGRHLRGAAGRRARMDRAGRRLGRPEVRGVPGSTAARSVPAGSTGVASRQAVAAAIAPRAEHQEFGFER